MPICRGKLEGMNLGNDEDDEDNEDGMPEAALALDRFKVVVFLADVSLDVVESETVLSNALAVFCAI